MKPGLNDRSEETKMTTHKLTFVGFTGNVRDIHQLPPKIHTISLQADEVPEELLTLKDCTYHGLISEVPKDILQPLLEKLDQESRLDMDTVFEHQITVCMLLNNKVLFLDMFANSDCYADHPMTAIGKAYIVRDRLDRLFPDQKLEYLPQCPKWFEKQMTYYKNNRDSKQRINTQLELLRLLSGKASDSTSSTS